MKMIFALCVAAIPFLATAQSVKLVRAHPNFSWNNSGFFKNRPASPFRDWGDYGVSLDGKQFTLWLLMAASGVAHGAREAYHADPYVFERNYGAGHESFWGADAWKRNYFGNDPERGHKHELLGNVGRDVWHTAGFVSKSGLITASFSIGSRSRIPMKYRITNWLLGFGAHSLFATITYQSLRQ